MNCYSPNFQGFILIKNALNNQVGMLGDMFLWFVANLKHGVIYFIKQACGNDILASVYFIFSCRHPEMGRGSQQDKTANILLHKTDYLLKTSLDFNWKPILLPYNHPTYVRAKVYGFLVLINSTP